ncbi:MAG: M48 family metalloprotease [Acidobacteria bacterium]|nr:M48 family metalloprotease [Acidobacteriota bacterium]
MARRDIWVAVFAVFLVPAAVDAGKDQKEEKVEGYAEWRRGECLIVDGQRVCPGPDMEFKGKDAAVDYDSIPLGYEVKAKGVRNADGALLAKKLEAKPNGMAMFEDDVKKGTNAAEAAYRQVGHMFERVDEDKAIDYGVLHESGPKVDRVRRITNRLLPPHVDPRDVRVYVVDNPEWNAMAMGNYSIYVFSGLLDDMNDDEVAIVLGHEIAHATHEHSRKQFKKQMWIQLAALGLGLVNEQVKDENANAIIELVGQFGSLAWQNGYGRSHEDQADRVGLRYAYEAGFDIDQGPELWRRFAQKYGQEDAVHNFFFSDHSLATKRAAHLEREIALNYPNGPKRAAGSAPQSTPPRRAAVKAKTSPPPPARGPREVTPGMTTDEVLALLGQPSDQITFGRKARWVYQDRTVVFEGGRVTTVRF